MKPESAYQQLLQATREYAILGSCAGVLGWDERTYMPRQGSAHRAEQMALLARLAHGMLTDGAVGELLAEVEASPPAGGPEGLAAANASKSSIGTPRGLLR